MEENSSTATHATCKRQPKWEPHAWGYGWPTLPWGYKYGRLALEVGGWATGRQPVTIKKLTDRKCKLWTQNSQSEWNQPTQWKTI
jgi:hypothetical protein